MADEMKWVAADELGRVEAYKDAEGVWHTPESESLKAEVVSLTAQRDALAEALLYMWRQYAFDVPDHEGWWHDGGMGALEEALELLLAAGLLERVAERPDKDWYRQPAALAKVQP